jgi:hypothetical protein
MLGTVGDTKVRPEEVGHPDAGMPVSLAVLELVVVRIHRVPVWDLQGKVGFPAPGRGQDFLGGQNVPLII